MDKLKSIKEQLVAQVQTQMGDLKHVDAKELGEVVDMIKDLEEAIYYCTVIEAMEKPVTNYYSNPLREEERYPKSDYYRDIDRPSGRLYYSEPGSWKGSAHRPEGGWMERNQETSRMIDGSTHNTVRDYREGKSPIRRKMYMESKELHQDKVHQMHELEEYMKELSTDITDMIKDASPEEKTVLKQKLANLTNMIS